MHIIDNKFEEVLDKKTYIALGSFDGLHLGHMSLIQKCIQLSKQHNGNSMVYTFKDHPLTVVNPNNVPKLLMDNASKREILQDVGIDILCLVEFNRKVMQTTAENFVIELLTKYNMGGVVVGFNYRFGHKNQGDVSLLQELAPKYNFMVEVMNPLDFNGELISSSRIRNLVEYGDITQANKMLSRPFMLSGEVIPGKQLGRTLGYPTANIMVDERFVIPKPGVYYTKIRHNGKFYLGMTNVGYNPTVESTTKINVETYILNFDKDIYGDEIQVFFIERIRDEVKFSSIEGLVSQMKKDFEYVKDKKIEEI
ncbi:bifunctional riboflavin kinase/FAD synthetase [Clostridium thermarum]|uniref:bifunctional riboflavin kinase/FAD synthetase n=1 Tax=Clostridium thermarum TaxID=1716543 RepID=UPI0013D57356|nr:bifunctional riboflavin kinase/FAD synthetase [Clostridium thermarum]